MTLSVRVPASSANLGPGFDCLGLALALYNRIRIAEASTPHVVVNGEGEHDLRRDPSNLAYRCATIGYQLSGRAAPAFALELHNAVPLSRGLGSSSTAIVGGLLAGAALAGVALSPDELVTKAAEIEGHPDNVAPAVYGGCTVAVIADGVRVAPIPFPAELTALVFVPSRRLSTAKARGVLPETVSRADAVFNLGRTALLVAALCTNRLDLLALAGEDRLHQDARAALIPALPRVLDAARQAGARLAALSGAGPSILALADDRIEDIAAAMTAAAGSDLPGRVLRLAVAPKGATVE
ncbi:MAG: homoserine kinase [Dehalococcoidia bacterium]|nr:MAG: homoserine kinase [Dehalococcoidia bacterium]